MRSCPPWFAVFWDLYPRKVGKRTAQAAFNAAVNRGNSAEAIVAGLRGYRFHADTQFQPHPTTWLRGDRWLDEVDSFDPVLRAAGLDPEDFPTATGRAAAMKNRQQWVAMLAKLVAPMDATRAAKALADMLPMLADFPDAAFCLDSLDAVATKRTSPPSYAELRSDLAKWWKQHRPQPTAIEGKQPATARQDEIDRDVSESWANITAPQVRAKIRELDGNGMRATLGHFLATAIAKHAPHHLGLLPPEWLDEPQEHRRNAPNSAPQPPTSTPRSSEASRRDPPTHRPARTREPHGRDRLGVQRMHRRRPTRRRRLPRHLSLPMLRARGQVGGR